MTCILLLGGANQVKHISTKKIIASITSVLILTLCLGGCYKHSQSQSCEEQQTYNTQTPLTVMQYTTFINREIVEVQNQLTSQILLLESVENGESSMEDALLSAQSSLKRIGESISIIDVTQPPNEMSDVRTRIMSLLGETEEILKNYVEILSKPSKLNSKAASSLKEQMKTNSFALTNEFRNGAV